MRRSWPMCFRRLGDRLSPSSRTRARSHGTLTHIAQAEPVVEADAALARPRALRDDQERSRPCRGRCAVRRRSFGRPSATAPTLPEQLEQRRGRRRSGSGSPRSRDAGVAEPGPAQDHRDVRHELVGGLVVAVDVRARRASRRGPTETMTAVSSSTPGRRSWFEHAADVVVGVRARPRRSRRTSRARRPGRVDLLRLPRIGARASRRSARSRASPARSAVPQRSQCAARTSSVEPGGQRIAREGIAVGRRGAR